ncbi:MAG: alanine--glyoxylate aminotransferase family protein [Proteobacteria bacterium]|nr:alanine--glyoxylate aminotransferase family protein [Pseudomonadota bacterium]MDA1059415.1 alanine--glyoxylate aminotransferase family protein [Pseudomonadota bacterium]
MTDARHNAPILPPRILMGPGPSDVSPRVLAAGARPTIGHLDPEFQILMDGIKGQLKRVFRTQNAVTFPVSGPGSVGMEACFVNLVEPGDTVIVCQNGVFGGRMKENVERCGGTVVAVDDDMGKPVDPDKLRAALKAHPETKVVAFVHAETSTGVVSGAATLCAIAREAGCLTIMDAVTSLAGIPVEVDAWGADAVYSGTQKCLSCPPGLSPITFSDRAIAAVKARKTKVQSWFLDLNLVLAYWDGEGGRSYHHTAPVNALFGLSEALAMVEEEGLENAWARHARTHNALRAGMEAMGIAFLVDPAYRLPQLNTVFIPAGLDDAATRGALLRGYGIEIGAGLGPFAGKIWRIGLMGESSRINHVLILLAALEKQMREAGVSVPGSGVEAAAAAA